MKELWDRLWNLPAELYGWIALVSTIIFILGVLAVPWLLARIPHDYFVTHETYLSHWKQSRPILRWLVLILRNLVGLALCLLGGFMLFFLGPRVVTLLLGISLTTFPGKRKLELSLLRRPGVLKWINRMRAKSNRKPLIIPDDCFDSAGGAGSD